MTTRSFSGSARTWAKVASGSVPSQVLSVSKSSSSRVSCHDAPTPASRVFTESRRRVVSTYKAADQAFLQPFYALAGLKYEVGAPVSRRVYLAKTIISQVKSIPSELIRNLETAIRSRRQAQRLYDDRDEGHQYIIKCYEHVLAILTRSGLSAPLRARSHGTRPMEAPAGPQEVAPKPWNLDGPWRRMN